MASYLDRYKSRVDQSNKLIANTKSSNLKSFEAHPFYSLVDINGIQSGVIVVQDDDKSEDKKLLLKPDTKVDIGTVVKMNELNYLTMDFLGEGINETYPTAILKVCNSTFPIQMNKTSVLVGYDSYNRPEFETVESTKQEPCIVEPRYFFKGIVDQMTNPQDSIAVTLKYQESDSLQENHEFDMYKSRYKITFIDYSKVINGKGVVTVTGERVINDGGI
jgi:hypothetical protein